MSSRGVLNQSNGEPHGWPAARPPNGCFQHAAQAPRHSEAWEPVQRVAHTDSPRFNRDPNGSTPRGPNGSPRPGGPGACRPAHTLACSRCPSTHAGSMMHWRVPRSRSSIRAAFKTGASGGVLAAAAAGSGAHAPLPPLLVLDDGRHLGVRGSERHHVLRENSVQRSRLGGHPAVGCGHGWGMQNQPSQSAAVV